MIGDVTGEVIEKYGLEDFELLREIVEEEHDKLFETTYCYHKRIYNHYIGNAYMFEFDQSYDYAVLYASQKMAKVRERANIYDINQKSWIYTVGKMLYENETGAKLGIGGIIQHRDKPFVICEFDGIVENTESPLYARIVKIKNVNNFGIPCEEDWNQMQLQMELCDLDFCDYVETQIGEYETEEEFFADEERTRGLVLVLHDGVEVVYKYMPLEISISVDEIKAWMETVYTEKYTLVKTIYWYLNDYEMKFLVRNQDWFDSVNS
jgi:hypothetical protein